MTEIFHLKVEATEIFRLKAEATEIFQLKVEATRGDAARFERLPPSGGRRPPKAEEKVAPGIECRHPDRSGGLV